MTDGRGSTIATTLPMAIPYGDNPDKVPPLNIYLVSQYDNTWPDTYQSFVVAAYTEDEARDIHPHTESTDWPITYETGAETWVDAEDIDLVVVQRIGTADPEPKWGAGTIYCKSFNEDRYEER